MDLLTPITIDLKIIIFNVEYFRSNPSIASFTHISLATPQISIMFMPSSSIAFEKYSSLHMSSSPKMNIN